MHLPPLPHASDVEVRAAEIVEERVKSDPEKVNSEVRTATIAQLKGEFPDKAELINEDALMITLNHTLGCVRYQLEVERACKAIEEEML